MTRLQIVGILALATALAGGAQAAPVAPPPDALADIAFGKQIADRSCGGCHAIDHGSSPLAGAPPFSELYRRYPTGGLAELLEEGMILPSDRMREEGTRYIHPRMPATPLASDEIKALTAYIRSLEPGR